MMKNQDLISDIFEDIVYELELNLQNIRRDLIDLLEEYKFKDCFICNRLKCCCSPNNSVTSSSFQSSTMTSSDSAYPQERDRSMDAYYNIAPPPETLPIPKWPENKPSNVHPQQKSKPLPVNLLNIWIKASIPNATQSNTRVNFPVPIKVLEEINFSWPPFPKSIWSDEKLKETVERENSLYNESESNSNNSVEAFFRHFGSNKAISKTTFAV